MRVCVCVCVCVWSRALDPWKWVMGLIWMEDREIFWIMTLRIIADPETGNGVLSPMLGIDPFRHCPVVWFVCIVRRAVMMVCVCVCVCLGKKVR